MRHICLEHSIVKGERMQQDGDEVEMSLHDQVLTVNCGVTDAAPSTCHTSLLKVQESERCSLWRTRLEFENEDRSVCSVKHECFTATRVLRKKAIRHRKDRPLRSLYYRSTLVKKAA
ncbi:hypothetical protein HPB50_000614 [Hyalomma asiaticum]|uniref:Uncharacterized protein n=1 Tax=Hyalomma asiaticum TaxID=266040 RepID=A0ACB7S615_HYAAI|nr:hypothetical protein HPB50_000614 [Hyalomma asiaticum]